jgi:uncharacterized delta-60 repeat protein
MKTRPSRSSRKFFVERLEHRSLLSGGPGGHGSSLPGTLDPGFGSAGIVTSSILGPSDTLADGVAIGRQSDGKLVVAGTAQTVGFLTDIAVARYNADGSLDTHFGNKGTVFTTFPGQTVSVSAVAVQPDGKVVVAGTLEGFSNNNNTEDFLLERYNSDGSLDKNFGSNGEVLTDFGPDSFSTASGIAITRNSQIIVSGTTTIDGVSDLGVAQYNTNGSLDKSFGNKGEAVINFGPHTSLVAAKNSVAIQPDGKIVAVVGVSDFTNGSVGEVGLARLNTNGKLDAGFRTGGLVTTTFNGLNVSAVAGVALEPGTNAIVVAGTALDPSFSQSVVLARYKASNGSLDTTFGTGGEVVTAPPPSTLTTVAGIAIQPSNGAIDLTGTASGFDSNSNFFQDLTVTRYLATNGKLDPSFGTNGQVLTSFGAGSRTTGAGIAIQSDGKIVAVGSVTASDGGPVSGFGVARFNTNGTLDRGFGTGGEVITNVPAPSSDAAAGEAIQSDGKIVVAGSATVFGPTGLLVEEFALTRYNSDGSIDKNFGNQGSVLTDFGTGTNQAVAITIQSDGKILVVGDIFGSVFDDFGEEIGLARYNKDGSLDKSFGNGGEVRTGFGDDTTAAASGLAIEPDGKIVVAGTVSGFDSDDNFFQNMALARYNSNGKLDTTFGNGGEVTTSVGADLSAAVGVAIQSNGKIVVAGTATDPDTFNNEFALARYNSNGKLDTTFGTGGEVTTTFDPDTSTTAAALAIQSNGKIVVAGTTTDPNTFNNDFALVRYNTDGSLDQTFGIGGEVATSLGANASANASALAIQPDGEIVVVGTVQDFSSSFGQEFGVVRYNTNGSLDQTFGNGGEVLTNFGPNGFGNATGVAIDSDGNIIVVGTTSDNGASDFTLVSYVGKKDHGHGHG